MVRADARPLTLGDGARVLVYAPRGAGGWRKALQSPEVTGSRLEVAETSGARGRTHPWLRRRTERVDLIVAVHDLVDAAEAAVEYDVPILAASAGDEPEQVGRQVRETCVWSETLLRIRPRGRTSRAALAECVVSSDDPGGLVRVRGDDGLDATMPVLRVVNRDPFGVMTGGGCEHTSPSMIGLCWTEDQPVADRVVPRNARLTVTAEGPGTVAVDCDGGRLRSLAEQLTIGPGWRLRVARPEAEMT